MTLSEIRDNYGNLGEKHIKRVGRFSATDLYKIVHDKITPKEFLEGSIMNKTGSRNCHRGKTIEYGVKLLLEAGGKEFDEQAKDVIVVDGIEYVAVIDFRMKKDGLPYKVLECKAPERFMGFKESNKDQCELQYRIFHNPIYIGYFDFVQTEHGKILEELGTFLYEPDDNRWATILKKTKEFNQRLIEYSNENT